MLSNSEMMIRLAVAAVLGSIVGIERERLQWAAGLRTHMLVSVGACLFMLVSAFGFSESLQAGLVVLDPSRVAAQVVSGIGFLGAGTILFRGEIIKGLTTAASLWAVAAVGLAVGGGLYIPAVGATVLLLVILAGIKPIEERFRIRTMIREIRLRTKQGNVTCDVIQKMIGINGAEHVQRFVVIPSAEQAGVDDITITLYRLPAKRIDDLVEKLGCLDGVISVSAE